MEQFIRESLIPFWKSGNMIRESIMLVEKDGVVSGRLRYKPKGKIRLRNSFLTEDYIEGRDYICKDGLIVCQNTEMPYIHEEILYGVNLPEEIKDDPKQYNIVNCLYSDSPYFISHQIAADYSFDVSECGLTFPDRAKKYLPNTLEKLNKKQAVRVLLFGDSISTGKNSSGYMNVEPFLPPWFDLMCEALEDKFGSKIELVNNSVSGMTSAWGIETAAQNVTPYESDLMIIAFGMNDGTGKFPVESFLENIRGIMRSQTNRNCEFILISSILPNPESDFVGLQEDYEKALGELKEEHIAVVDMTEIHRHLLQGKRYCDMTGNNINHPNDFLARCHTMRIMELFE